MEYFKFYKTFILNHAYIPSSIINTIRRPLPYRSENDEVSEWRSPLSPNWVQSVGPTGFMGYGNMLKQVCWRALRVLG